MVQSSSMSCPPGTLRSSVSPVSVAVYVPVPSGKSPQALVTTMVSVPLVTNACDAVTVSPSATPLISMTGPSTPKMTCIVYRPYAPGTHPSE